MTYKYLQFHVYSWVLDARVPGCPCHIHGPLDETRQTWRVLFSIVFGLGGGFKRFKCKTCICIAKHVFVLLKRFYVAMNCKHDFPMFPASWLKSQLVGIYGRFALTGLNPVRHSIS